MDNKMNNTRVDDMLIEMITPKVKQIEEKFGNGEGLSQDDINTLLLKSQYNTENIIPIISSLRSKGLKIKKIRAQNSYICLNHSKLPKKRIR